MPTIIQEDCSESLPAAERQKNSLKMRKQAGQEIDQETSQGWKESPVEV